MQPLWQWKTNNYYIFWVCVCSLRYTVCNAHAPYCCQRLLRLDYIFSTLSHKRYHFRKKKSPFQMALQPGVGLGLR